MYSQLDLTRTFIACALAALWSAGPASTATAVPPQLTPSPRPMLDADIEPFDSRVATNAGLQREFDTTLATIGGAGGSDTCQTTTPVLLAVPDSTTLFGDNSAATGPDVCQFNLGTVWWESFEIAQCASVTLDLCGTSPAHSSNYTSLVGLCTPDGSACGNYHGYTAWDRTTCPDGNITIQFDALPAGTYYYPITTSVQGPYQINITTSECIGACCDLTAGTCTNGVPEGSCSNPDQVFNGGNLCCATECRDPAGPTYDALNVDLLGHVSIEDFATWRGTPGDPHSANEVWGYVSPSGREYAIIGFTTGAGFVDITVPTAPVIVGYIDGGGVDTVWRDMAIYGTYCYIVTDGSGVGLQIVDLSDIDSGTVTLVNTTDLGAGFDTAHNVYVNAETGYLYLPLPNLNSGNGLVAVNLLPDPVNPTVAGTWTDPDPGVRCHDVQVVKYFGGPYGGREIAFCFAEDNGLKIADVTNKAAMFTVSTLAYPTVSYTHQGWLTPDRQYVMIGDELDEYYGAVSNTTTYVVDVSDINTPTMAATFEFDTCNIDHNLMVRRERVYEANYATGLRVLDATDPLNMIEVAYFDTRPEDNIQDFEGAWGVFTDFPSNVIVLSDRSRGLFILEDDQPLPPEPEIPTVSEWGLLVLTLSLLTCGALAIRNRAARAGARGIVA